jgi:putative endonuclease
MPRDYNFYVYILFDEPAHATYIGVTNDLERRIYEHKLELIDGFTKRKHIHKLAYYEYYTDINTAIAREKALKNWKCAWKYRLIETMNPDWVYLAAYIDEQIAQEKNKKI